ncbi:MAG: hypothetical protein EAZ16_15140 [Sphingobacteriales bacterium]|nr:MAG: hypothetical protein EAZ16_15140 [Sphingobacteriales bacterium]
MVQFFKRIAYRKGRAVAITANARKLSVILYNMITKKQDYKPAEPIQPSEKSKNKIIKAMKQNIEKLKLSKEQIEFLFNPTSLSVT